MSRSAFNPIVWFSIFQFISAYSSFAGGDDVHLKPEEEKMLLEVAILQSDAQVVRGLLDRNPKLASDSTWVLRTAAQSEATESKQWEVLQYLKQKGIGNVCTYSSDIPAQLYRIEPDAGLKRFWIHSNTQESSFDSKSVFLQSPAMMWLRETPLVLAIVHGNDPMAQFLLKECDLRQIVDQVKGAWILPRGSGSMDFLRSELLIWAAASQGMWPTVGLLFGHFPPVQNGQNFNAVKNELGQNFLHAIAQAGQPYSEVRDGLCGAILAHGQCGDLKKEAILNTLDQMEKHRDVNGQQPADYLKMIQVEKLHKAVREGDSRCVQRLLKEDPTLLEVLNQRGFHVLHTAAYYGRVEMLKVFQENWPDLNFWVPAGVPWQFADISDRYYDYPPLLLALSRGHGSVAQFFLDRISESVGSSRKERSFAIEKLRRFGQLALGFAVAHRFWSILENLLELLGPEWRKSSQMFVLDILAAEGIFLSDLPNSLLSKLSPSHSGGGSLREVGRQEFSDVDSALSTGDISQFNKLLPVIRNSFNAFIAHDRDGLGPVHKAALDGQVEVLSWLRENFPQIDFFQKTQGLFGAHDSELMANQTPLALAMIACQEKAALLLLDDFSADSMEKRRKGELQEKLGFQYLRWAAEGHLWEVMRKLMPMMDPEEIYWTDSEGCNFLHIIARSVFHFEEVPKDLLNSVDPLAFQVRNHEGLLPKDLLQGSALKDRDFSMESIQEQLNRMTGRIDRTKRLIEERIKKEKEHSRTLRLASGS